MLQRLTDIFWPPKWKAALGAIFSLVLAVVLYSSGTLAVLGTVALIYGLWYAGVWLYKFSRDKQLAAIRIGRDYFIDPNDFEDFLKRHRTDRKDKD